MTEKELRTIVAHPFLALAREFQWDDRQLEAAKKLIDITTIRLSEGGLAVPPQLHPAAITVKTTQSSAGAVPPAPSGAPAPATIVEPGLIQLARKRCEQYRVDGYDSLADAVWNFAHECVRLLPKRSSWVAAPAPSALEKEG